jgi:hypothetical protein
LNDHSPQIVLACIFVGVDTYSSSESDRSLALEVDSFFLAAQVDLFITKPVQAILAEVFVVFKLVTVRGMTVPVVVAKFLGLFP